MARVLEGHAPFFFSHLEAPKALVTRKLEAERRVSAAEG